jgi:class 3 adenylate cyclase
MNRDRVFFGLRQKIILTFLGLGIVVSGVLASTSFAILSRSLFGQLQDRVLGLARVAAETLDPEMVARLAGSLARTPTPDAAEAEASADYRAISERLNTVRSVDEQLVRYIYLFVPGPDAATALFLVDADVLAFPDEEEVSHFGDEFDVSTFPVAARALAERVPLVEATYSFDEDFGVNSLSGYAPVPGLPDGITAVVGVDMVDTDVRAALLSARTFSSLAIVGTIVLTVLASVVMGTLFTRGIVSLDGVVKRFGEQDFDVRVPVLSKDEVGRLGRSFNEMADSIQDYRARQDALHQAAARFVPEEFLKLLGNKSIESVQPGDQAAQTMTVLFADIRGFTTLAEKMSLEQVFRFLNSYLERMRPEITSMGGFIDKYIGDAIMALFPGRPDDALAAAAAMQGKIPEYNRHRANSGFEPIGIGIGVHVGPLMLGTVGDSHRMDGTVISDAVNLSSRLEGLTRRYGAGILTTGETLKLLAEPARFRFRFVDRVKVYGRANTTLVFECLDGDPDETRDRKLSYRSDLARALRFYYKGSFKDALDIIIPLSREHGDDAVLHLYRQRCDRFLRKGVRPGWDVEVLADK